jgi:DNA-binding transcriptional LysR family regulator
MTDLNGMRVFVAVAEAGSLTGAARQLDLPKSTISRRLQAYETAIGVTLFRRSTRSVSLTDAGKRHFERVQPLIGDATQAFDEVASESDEPSGLIRVSATVGIGQHFLAPLVFEFMEKHPKVRVELLLTEKIVDLVADGVDFAIRMGDLDDSELLARRLQAAKRLVVASPSLFDRYPLPNKVQDLRHLPAVVISPSLAVWQFANGEDVRVNWHMAAGNIAVARKACLAKRGIALLPEPMVAGDIRAGHLMVLLDDISLPKVSTTIVYPRQRHQSAAARAFLQALIRN